MNHRTRIEAVISQFVVELKSRLFMAQWRTHETCDVDIDGHLNWFVVGYQGGRIIQGDGATQEEAWICAFEQARSLGLSVPR